MSEEKAINKFHVSSIDVDPEILEEAIACYLDPDYMVEQPERLYRWHRGERRYFKITETEEEPRIDWYNSVTTVIKHTVPKDEFLVKWIADMGYSEAKLYTKERGYYGTFLHIMIEYFLIEKELDLDSISLHLKEYIEKEKVDCKTDWFEDRAKKDLLSFAKFASDYNLRPRAIELVLASEMWKIGGAIDCVAEMTAIEVGDFGEVYKSGDKKGQPKMTKGPVEFTGLLDWKSSLKGFYPENEMQVSLYHDILWKENFPEIPVDRRYLWRPTDWRTTPGYELKEVKKDFRTYGQLIAHLSYANSIMKLEPSSFTEISGGIKLGEAPENSAEITPEEYISTTMIKPTEKAEEQADAEKTEGRLF